MIHRILEWSHSVFAETVTALCINTVAIVGTLAIWSDLELFIKCTIGLVDAVIAITSLFWLRSKTQKNKLAVEDARLEVRKKEIEIEKLELELEKNKS